MSHSRIPNGLQKFLRAAFKLNNPPASDINPGSLVHDYGLDEENFGDEAGVPFIKNPPPGYVQADGESVSFWDAWEARRNPEGRPVWIEEAAPVDERVFIEEYGFEPVNVSEDKLVPPGEDYIDYENFGRIKVGP